MAIRNLHRTWPNGPSAAAAGQRAAERRLATPAPIVERPTNSPPPAGAGYLAKVHSEQAQKRANRAAQSAAYLASKGN